MKLETYIKRAKQLPTPKLQYLRLLSIGLMLGWNRYQKEIIQKEMEAIKELNNLTHQELVK